jgi:hypothetical protein
VSSPISGKFELTPRKLKLTFKIPTGFLLLLLWLLLRWLKG